MRYSITSKSMTLEQLDIDVKKVGATDVRAARLLGQIFCQLDEGQAKVLARVPGLTLKQLKEYKTDQVLATAPAAESILGDFGPAPT